MKLSIIRLSSIVACASALIMLSPMTAMSAESEMSDHERHQGKRELREEMRDKHRAKRHEHKEKMAIHRMEMADANKDGQLDLSEYLANAEQRFNSMDLDGNGLVTPDEASQWSSEMRAKHMADKKAARKARKPAKHDEE